MNQLRLTYFISSFLDYCRILSIDVALGGVVLSNSLAYAFGERMPYSVSIALFISIWLIYSLDHYWDAKKMVRMPSMKRHTFHQENQKLILVLMAFMVIAGICTLFFLPLRTLVYGLVVTVIVGIYFFLSWKLRVVLIKEVLIASVYATGILLAPVSLFEIDLTLLGILLSMVFGIALINLMLFSYFEMEYDQSDGCHSWATKFGLKETKQHITILFVLQFLLHGVFFIYFDTFSLSLTVLLIAMTLVLLSIFLFPNFFIKNERYRLFGDIIFFLPGLIFWL